MYYKLFIFIVIESVLKLSFVLTAILVIGSNGNRRMVGLDDLVGPFQPCVSMILS